MERRPGQSRSANRYPPCQTGRLDKRYAASLQDCDNLGAYKYTRKIQNTILSFTFTLVSLGVYVQSCSVNCNVQCRERRKEEKIMFAKEY
jgi:hypothetical protein